MSGNSKVEILVLSAYSRDARVANDDKVLLASVWHLQGWDDTRSLYENLKRVSPAESVTRARRKLIQSGQIKASEEATKRREEQFREHLDEYGSFKNFGKAVSWFDD